MVATARWQEAAALLWRQIQPGEQCMDPGIELHRALDLDHVQALQLAQPVHSDQGVAEVQRARAVTFWRCIERQRLSILIFERR